MQPFPSTGAKYQVPGSADNHHPLWSPDGKELFYLPGPGQFASVRITTQPTFAFGNPVPAPATFNLEAPSVPRSYDITPDGQRFIGVIPSGQTQTGAPATPQIQVVLNWFEDLKQRVPVP